MVPLYAKGVCLVQPGGTRAGRLAGTRPAFWFDRLGFGWLACGLLDLLGWLAFSGVPVRWLVPLHHPAKSAGLSWRVTYHNPSRRMGNPIKNRRRCRCSSLPAPEHSKRGWRFAFGKFASLVF